MERIEKINKILIAIKHSDKLGDIVSKNKLVGECSKLWGTSRRTTLEYLQELVARQEIVIEGDNVMTRARWKKIINAREKSYLDG